MRRAALSQFWRAHTYQPRRSRSAPHPQQERPFRPAERVHRVLHRLRKASRPTTRVLSYVWRLWWQKPGQVLAVAGLGVLATAADLFIPLFSGNLVDAIAAPHPLAARHAALAALATILALAAGQIAARTAAVRGIVVLTLRTMRALTEAAFFRAQRFSAEWHASNFAGSTVRLITRGRDALDLLNDTVLLMLLPAVLALAGATLIMGLRWPVMGAIVGGFSLLYLSLVVLLVTVYVSPAATLSNAADTAIGGALSDAIGCNYVVKSFAAEDREDAHLARLQHRWRIRTRRFWLRATDGFTLQLCVLLGLRAGILGTVTYFWWIGRATAGDAAFVLAMYFVIHAYLREVGMHVSNLQRSINGMEEVVDLMDIPIEVADAPGAKPLHPREGKIEFDNVSFQYGRHAAPLYRNLSITIEGGERVGLVGVSGSGKSTFVKLIERFYDVTGGEIRIDGQNIARVTQASLRRAIALVPQEPVLFHRSLADNIAYGRPGASQADIERAARLAHAHDFIARLPKGYRTPVGERGVKLSGGERQRVALARAFLADAPILILDEATSSLDTESEALIQHATARLMANRTALVIAHRLSTVQAMDRILVFENGEIVEQGTHASLLACGGRYRKLYETQLIGFAVEA